MIDIGFARGVPNSTVFHRQSTGCRCVVHGDDFTFLCHGDRGEELVDKVGQWYDLTVRAVIGDDDGDDKEVTSTGRRNTQETALNTQWTRDTSEK